MVQLSKERLLTVVGGTKAEFDLLVANAHVNGAHWTAAQWNSWARKLEKAAH